MPSNLIIQRFRGVGFTLVRDVVSGLSNSSGELAKSVGFEVSTVGNTVVLQGVVTGKASKYWFFADQGRKPGKQPPIKSMLQYIKAKGITPDGNTTKEQLAFLFARKIGRDGTKGSKAFTNAIENFKQSTIEQALLDEANQQYELQIIPLLNKFNT